MKLKSFVRIESARLISVVIGLLLAAVLCGILEKLTWHHSLGVSRVFDIAGFALFWASYALLWVLLVIVPFRPHSHFSLRGECSIRALNFFLTLGSLVIVHLYVILMAFH